MTARRALILAVLVLVVVVGGLAGRLAFGTRPPPQPLASISEPFKHIDFRDLPAVATYPARDGAALAYRVYDGSPDVVVVLIHGSAGSGSSMHALAKALRADGATIYAPDMRGHGASGPRGDVAYLGQLDDDLDDFMQLVRSRHPHATITLAGFSAGGGFTLRIAGGSHGTLFDRYLLISPALCPNAPTCRPGGDAWVSIFMPRIIALRILRLLGVHWFEGLPVVAFAVQPGMENRLTATYSARLAMSFRSHEDFLGDLRRASKPMAILVGGADELFYADQFGPLVHSVRPDIPVQVLAGLGHIDMITAPAALDAVKALVAPPS